MAKPKGRPRLYPSEGKRKTLTFRVRQGTYDMLFASASEHERSLSEEIEYRLRRSFEQPNLVEAVRQEIRQVLAEPPIVTVHQNGYTSPSNGAKPFSRT